MQTIFPIILKLGSQHQDLVALVSLCTPASLPQEGSRRSPHPLQSIVFPWVGRLGLGYAGPDAWFWQCKRSAWLWKLYLTIKAFNSLSKPEIVYIFILFQGVTIPMGIFVALLTVTTVLNVTANRCVSHSLTMSYQGRYCIGKGTVTHNLLPHQCRYLCLQSSRKAYNYNITEGTCTQFTSPCPQAYTHPVMEFVVFRETPVNQCYEWVPYSPDDPLDERMITIDSSWCIVSRLQISGSNVVGYFHTRYSTCYSNLEGDDHDYSSKHGYLCDRLRIREGCTIFWVPYKAGEPLPLQAVIGSVMANGDVAYVVKFECVCNGEVVSISGYHTEGATHAIGGYYGTRYSTAMMMMIVL